MTAREAITEMRDMISDRHGDYHQDDDALRYLNRAAQYISAESESVRSGMYRAVEEGRNSYGLPLDLLQIDFVGFKGRGESRYTPLHPLRQSTSQAINQNVENGHPIYYSLWGRAARERLVAPVTEGTEATFKIAGSLPSDIGINDVVLNVTDRGADARVTKVVNTPDESVECTRLAGGERNTFEGGDTVRILSPDRGSQTLHISPPPDFTSDPGEENMFVYHAHKHRVISQLDIDNENDLLEIDPNLEEAFLHRMCYHASVADKNVSDATAQYFDGKYNFHYKRAMPRVRQKNRQFKSLWFEGQAIERARDVNLIGYTDSVGHSGNTYRIL
ncbi:MAG: hypothetical protein OXN17_08335 [Candidatus Poribacteria bacterium]|nr:hypothetical protein [Candidatus Poribacteria bacterium]MDE0505415.1 hypothetical protein [Candidatus Poribacteria bacterium]